MIKKSFAAALVMALSAPVFAAEYIVKLKDTVKFDTVSSKSSFMKLSILDSHRPGQLLKVNIDDKQADKKIAQILNNQEVEYVVKSFQLKAFRLNPLAQNLREQWHIGKINAPNAWSMAGNKGSQKVTVAVIDTGIDYRHESLKENMVPGYDFRDNDNDPMDETSNQNPGHGTHCAGIIGATGLIANGTVGASPDVAIMPIRFLGADGSGDLMGGIKSIDYAIEKHVNVISASWGATIARSQAQPLIEAVKRASDAGIIFISAAANDGSNNDTTDVFPANAKFENTITVAASDSNDAKPSWSNYGTAMVDIASPGLNIMSTIPGNNYRNLSGTSMATPLVSGVVAFLLAQEPSLTGAQVRSLLQMTGVDVNIQTASRKRIDAHAAMVALTEGTMIPVPAAVTLEKNASINLDVLNGAAPYSFTSSNPSVLTVDEKGKVSAVADGEATISVKDANNKTATTLAYHVGAKSGGDDGGGGTPGECPLGDPQMCEALCQIMPSLPWCK